MAWKCPKCGREFSRQNQDHYCVKPQNIDEYIAAQDEKYKPRLMEISADSNMDDSWILYCSDCEKEEGDSCEAE